MNKPLVYAEGDMVRVGTDPGIVKRIRLDGSVDVWTDRGLRTVTSNMLRPTKRGDSVIKSASPAPQRKPGQR